MPRVIGPVVIEISGNTIKFTKAVGQASARMQVFQRRMKAAGAAMTRYMTLPLIAAGAASLKFAVDFNKAMANVATLIPGNIERVRELKKEIQALAIETGKAPTDLAAGMYEVISAFGDSAEAMDQLTVSTRAAVAGITGTQDAVKLLSAVTKGYGDTSAPAMAKAADILFKIIEKGQTNFAELRASMGQVLPWAEKLGVDFEELAAGFSALTGVTGGTAEVATQLSGAFAGLAAGTPDVEKALKKLGGVTIEELIATKGLQGALIALVGTTDKTAGAIKKLTGRKEGAMAIMALTGKQARKYTDDLEAMKDALGANTAAYDEQTKGINEAGHALNQLKSATQVAGQQLGDILVPALLKLTIKVKELVDGFNSLDDSTKKLIVTLGILVAASGPLAKMTVLFTKLIPLLGKARVGLLALSVPLGPIGLIAGAIAALAASVMLLRPKKILDTAVAIEDLNEAIRNAKQLAIAGPAAEPLDLATLFGFGPGGFPAAVKAETVEIVDALAESTRLVEAEMRGYWTVLERALGAGIKTKLQGPGREGKPHVFAEAEGWFAELAESIQLTQDHLTGFADSWAETVALAIVEGELLSLKLSDFFKHITQELLKMAIAMKVTRPLFDAVAGALNPGGGAPAGTGATWSPSGTEPPMQNWGSSAPISFEFHDHHAAPGEMEVTEKRGAGGARVFEIMVRDAWKKSFAANAFDSDLARMGAVRQGVGR